jgi:hypothetical protein
MSLPDARATADHDMGTFGALGVTGVYRLGHSCHPTCDLKYSN